MKSDFFEKVKFILKDIDTEDLSKAEKQILKTIEAYEKEQANNLLFTIITGNKP